MIASFSRKLVFVKTRKVGGTSLEIVLSSWCSGEDICSPIPPEDERIRQALGGAPRNFAAPDGTTKFYNHMPATEIQAALPELWADAFKFSLERHPYEKVVSRAWWNVGRKGGLNKLALLWGRRETISAEIEKVIQDRSYLNFELYTKDRKLLVDEVWPHHEMNDRLAKLARRLGVPTPPALPRAKGGYRKDTRPAREVLTKDQRDQIYEGAAFEFELMGYDR